MTPLEMLPAQVPDPSTDSPIGSTICPYCGVGCGLNVELRDGLVSRVRGNKAHAGTQGMLCRKAVYLPQAVNAQDRLSFPWLREGRLRPFNRVSWEMAMGWAAERFARIITEHGPDSVGFYISGQLLSEDYYVVNKLAKGFIGTNNVDSNSRLCMSSAVSAYQLALGKDGPPCAYEDLDLANCFLFIGSNAADCHPVLFKRALARRAAQENVGIIVIDPRRTATAREADIHLQLRPGTDLPLLYGLLHVAIRDGLLSREFIEQHTDGWAETQAAALQWDPVRVADATGVTVELLERAARMFASSPASLSFWAMGVNQNTDGVDRSLALINLHLATGHIGRAGAGPFSLTGQPNAMGGREVGGLAALLPGHRLVVNESHRREMEAHWRVPAERIQPKPGLTAVEMFDALASGKMKAVWIAATNPMVSMPNLDAVRAGLERAELVVVQDAYFPTETSEMAHLALPAAQWAEKDGTSTSSERRISYMPALVEAPGRARPDWAIFAELGQRLGYGPAFNFRDAEAVFNEYRESTRGTDMDITGISYERLRTEGGLQWPCPDETSPGTTRLYMDLQFGTANGRARFHAPEWRPQAAPTMEHDLVLTTGRERDQWHTMTRTGNVPQLMKSCPEPYLAVNPDDACRLSIQEGDWVEMQAPEGMSARFQARLTADVPLGTVFAPFHWGTLRNKGGSLNTTTDSAFDPISKQPALKYRIVQVRLAAARATPIPLDASGEAISGNSNPESDKGAAA
ncbi:MAG: molybdopterin oxidoreductase family protein [Chloroflexota bacterium]